MFFLYLICTPRFGPLEKMTLHVSALLVPAAFPCSYSLRLVTEGGRSASTGQKIGRCVFSEHFDEQLVSTTGVSVVARVV